MKGRLPVSSALVACAVSALSSTARGDEIKLCSPPYRTILVEGGFSGIANCDGGTLEANEVGKITVAGKAYVIVHLRYTTKPVPGGSAHGGERILIIEDGQKYVGQYAIGTPPFHSVSIRRTSVLISIPANEGNEIKFSDQGPPQETYLAGAPATLFK